MYCWSACMSTISWGPGEGRDTFQGGLCSSLSPPLGMLQPVGLGGALSEISFMGEGSPVFRLFSWGVGGAGGSMKKWPTPPSPSQLLIHPIGSQVGVETSACSAGCQATWLIAEPGQQGGA